MTDTLGGVGLIIILVICAVETITHCIFFYKHNVWGYCARLNFRYYFVAVISVSGKIVLFNFYILLAFKIFIFFNLVETLMFFLFIVVIWGRTLMDLLLLLHIRLLLVLMHQLKLMAEKLMLFWLPIGPDKLLFVY